MLLDNIKHMENEIYGEPKVESSAWRIILGILFVAVVAIAVISFI